MDKFSIANEPDVLRVLSNQPKEVIDWGLKRIGAEKAWLKTKGASVKVAVLDTGADIYHPDLRQNIKGTINMTNSKFDVLDKNGHGTHVSGIIAAVDNDIGMVGIAPEADLYIAKVLGDDGSGTMDGIIRGIRWAIAQNVDVINLSLGMQHEPKKELHQAIKEAKARGIIIIAASGNEDSEVGWPARYPETICVAASDQQDRRATFSNKGIENVISAPGVDILSTYKDGTYAELSGTSMAAPIIAGAAALYIAYFKDTYYEKPTFNQVYDTLTTAVDDVGEMGRDKDYGVGIINLAKMF